MKMTKTELKEMIREVFKEEFAKTKYTSKLQEAIINELPYDIIDDLVDDYNKTYAGGAGYPHITRVSVTMSDNGTCMLRAYLADKVTTTNKTPILRALFDSYAAEPGLSSLISCARVVSGGSVIAFPPYCLDYIGIDSMNPEDFM